MKTIVVTDALAAELVAKNEAEYAAEVPHIAEPAHPAVTAALPPVVAHSENGQRVDQPCPPGTPGTVTLTKTGHTLSLPAIDRGEMFIGYCQRVWRQCGAKNPDSVGALFLDSGFAFKEHVTGKFNPDGSNWPIAADLFFNNEAYMTDEEKSGLAESQRQWAAHNAAVEAREREAQQQAITGGRTAGENLQQPQNTVSAPQPVETEVPVTQEQA